MSSSHASSQCSDQAKSVFLYGQNKQYIYIQEMWRRRWLTSCIPISKQPYCSGKSTPTVRYSSYTTSLRILRVYVYYDSTYTTSPRILRVHVYYESTYTTSPRILRLHVYYDSTYTTTPRILRVHVYYDSTYTTTPRILRVNVYFESTYTTSQRILTLMHITVPSDPSVGYVRS